MGLQKISEEKDCVVRGDYHFGITKKNGAEEKAEQTFRHGNGPSDTYQSSCCNASNFLSLLICHGKKWSGPFSRFATDMNEISAAFEEWTKWDKSSPFLPNFACETTNFSFLFPWYHDPNKINVPWRNRERKQKRGHPYGHSSRLKYHVEAPKGNFYRHYWRLKYHQKRRSDAYR